MKLINADCFDALKTLPARSIDLILTDPPYGTTACKWDSVIPFTWHIRDSKNKVLYLYDALLKGVSVKYFQKHKKEGMWEHLKRIRKPGAPVLLCGTEPFSSHLRLSNLNEYKYDWYWDKVRGVGFQIAKYRPLQRIETISVFCAGTVNYYPQTVKRDNIKKSKCSTKSESNPLAHLDGKERTYTTRQPTSLIKVSNSNQNIKQHPTQKPVPLMTYLIRTYTQPGDTVLDFTMGSGTTGVACVQLNRNFIGIEKDKKYFDIAEKRIDNMKKKKR